MTVAVVHWSFAGYWGPRIGSLADSLQARGDSLVVVEVTARDPNYTFAAGERPDVRGAEWVRLFGEGENDGIGMRRVSAALWSLLEERQPHIVLSSAIAFPTGATSVRWARSRKRGVVIMDNARMHDVPRSRLVNHVKRRIYRNVDAVLIPAPSHAGSFVNWGVREDRLFYGLNVADNEYFRERAERARQGADGIRAEHGLPARYFLGLGRQVAKKNWGCLISAYAEYRRTARREPWELLLVGDGSERAHLRRQVADADLVGVRFLPFCSPSEACLYYALAEALVLPGFYGETWGLVVNEAMACGLPVLVSEQCGCAQALVRSGENGWTFRPDRPRELARLMVRIADLRHGERRAMGAASRRIIAEWPLERFARGALDAIDACKGTRRGFVSVVDRLLLSLWKGRFRPS